jgi:hypothetical protein
VENTRDFYRLRRALVNHEISLPHQPEKNRLVRQIWTFVAESRIVRQRLARIVNIRFELIGSRDVVGGDETPDLLRSFFASGDSS